MNDIVTRTKIRTLQQQVGLLVQQVERLESVVGEFHPGTMSTPLSNDIISPEALRAVESGAIASAKDYVPPQDGHNAVEGGEVPAVSMASSDEMAQDVYEGMVGGPTVYTKRHEHFGRWVILTDGEVDTLMIGDHPQNPTPGQETDKKPDQRWWTKDGADEMIDGLIKDDAERAANRAA